MHDLHNISYKRITLYADIKEFYIHISLQINPTDTKYSGYKRYLRIPLLSNRTIVFNQILYFMFIVSNCYSSNMEVSLNDMT